MFTIKLIKVFNPVSFEDCPCLIDKGRQHRSLGEIVALARQTGIPPLVTRNGVYVGDLDIPRDKHDKANLQREMASKMASAESKLLDATKELNELNEAEKASKLEADLRQKIAQETKS